MGYPAGLAIAEVFYRTNHGPFGWSEVYWPSEQATNLPGCLVQLNEMIPLRLAFMPVSVTVDYARVSTTGLPRNALVAGDSIGLIGTYIPSLASFELPIDGCILCKLQNGDESVGRKFLHALTTDDITGDEFTPTTAFIGFFNAWATNMVSNFMITDTIGDQIAIESLVLERFTEHKVGRPFGLRRGRAPAGL